jgi:hypothetical protein
LHGVMEHLLTRDDADTVSDHDAALEMLQAGYAYKGQELTQALLDDKIFPALAAMDSVDPERRMIYEPEPMVSFGTYIPDAFGYADIVGRIDDRLYVIDYKFGDGVRVQATKKDGTPNPQLMFYAAAARRTTDNAALQTLWAGVKDVELVIIQPPYPASRTTVSLRQLQEFETELRQAVRTSHEPDAPFAYGDHCRWCSAKALCPVLTGLAEETTKIKLANIHPGLLGQYLDRADLLDDWAKAVRQLAYDKLSAGQPVSGYKLVHKRATRTWKDEAQAEISLRKLIGDQAVTVEVLSPARAEKALKKLQLEFPSALVEAKSSGTTIAPDDDPRPAIAESPAQKLAGVLARASIV